MAPRITRTGFSADAPESDEAEGDQPVDPNSLPAVTDTAAGSAATDAAAESAGTESHGTRIVTVADRINAATEAASEAPPEASPEQGPPHCLACGRQVERPEGYGKQYAICPQCGNTVRFSDDAMQQAFYAPAAEGEP